MAYTTINKSTDYFNTKLYTGTGSAQNITGVGFQPDWCWFKNRSAANDPLLYDAVRGVSGKDIRSSATDGSGTDAQGLTAFGSDGFSIGLWESIFSSEYRSSINSLKPFKRIEKFEALMNSYDLNKSKKSEVLLKNNGK